MPLYGQTNTPPHSDGPDSHSLWGVQTRLTIESALRSVAKRQPVALRYGIALALTLIALGLTYLFRDYVGDTRFVFFSGAVVLAALNGGFGPGLLATALSVVCADYFLIEPLYSLFSDPSGIIQAVVLVLVVALVSGLQEARLRTQERLARTTSQLNVILQHVGAGITAQRAKDYRLVFANEAAAKQAGFDSPDDMLSMAPAEMASLFEVYDDHGQRLDYSQLPGRRAADQGAGAGQMTYRLRRVDTGMERWIHHQSVPIYDEKNEPALIVSIMQDISDQKRLEAMRRQEEQRVHAVLDNLGIFVGLLTPDGIVIEANHAALAAANLKPEDVVGKPFEETYWWSYSETTQARLRDAIERTRKGERVAYDVELRVNEAKFIIVAFQLAPIYEGERIKYLLPSAVDITWREQIQIELQEVNSMLHWQQQRLNRIINNVPGVIWEGVGEPSIDSQQLTFVSDHVEHMLGYTAQEVYATKGIWRSVVHPADHESAAASMAAAFRESKYTVMEFRMIAKSGRVFPVEVHTTIVPDEAGNAVAACGVIMDVSSRKAAEERAAEYAAELQHSNEELHQFAYVASHDLQEPLRMVSSYLQLLEKRYGDKLDGNAREYIDFAIDGAVRMKALIMDLLAYSRVESQRKTMAWLHSQQALDKALANLKVAIEERGASITADALPEVWGDETQLTQLFQNLIGNAIKFCGDKPPEVKVGAVRQGNAWLFSVTDNGIGIEAEYHERIFAIFQRLHGKGKYPGTGIGLAVCRKIVERHGGRIWVDSSPGKGSTFYFTLPAESKKESHVHSDAS